MTELEIYHEAVDLSFTARNHGHIDLANNLLLGILGSAKGSHFKFSLEDLGAHIQAISQAADQNGHKYTACN